jgi:hypothetical protein
VRPQLQARLKRGGKEGGRRAILLVRTGIALVIDVKKAGVEMNRTATWALLAHTTITLQSITHSTSAGRHPVRHWGLVVA